MLSVKLNNSRARIAACRVACLGLLLLLGCFALTLESHARRKDKARNGRIEISTSPGGYPVLIDGRPAGETTAAVRLIELEPGTHTVEIQFPNGAHWVREFVVQAGRRECIALSYRPRTVAIPRPLLLSPCPYPVNVSTPAVVNDGDIVAFSADVDYQGDSKLNYTWSVSPSSARIIGGAGTPSISVDSTGLGRQRVTAVLTVDDGSGDATCRREAQASTSVLIQTPLPSGPRRFDEFPSVAFDDDKARLDNLAIELQNNPGAIGYVIVYGGRHSRAGHAEILGERTRNYLVDTRGIEASRVQIVKGGYRERAAYELWLLPPGAQPPPPTPTVQRSEAPSSTGLSTRPRRR